eukprot:gnl/TRDRNA2_/TRDRNA2_123736_c2_seq1.p1 gnl/TRDRNA2_/TRDRNA2_123736_c2~~gnl/TRDRNA2_/TRDRNA2_123736_c2_seq1.p1  ORF type:complete len:233 (-),score=46.23 gnl/TRDRNA2_/TRDRNA2_123736_c2_seq1:30-668(-)
MTHDAQAALRRIMEEFVQTTRFIIICNYVSKIIEPLHSRCSKFRFQPIGTEFQKARLLYICGQEGVKVSPGALSQLITLSKGDLRYAVTILQSATAFYGDNTELDEAALTEVACAVPEHLIKGLIQSTVRAKSTDEISIIVRDFLLQGYSGQQILQQLLSIITLDPSIPDLNKAKCATLFSLVDERLTKGCDEELQFHFLFSALRPLIQMAK